MIYTPVYVDSHNKTKEQHALIILFAFFENEILGWFVMHPMLCMVYVLCWVQYLRFATLCFPFLIFLGIEKGSEYV